MHAYGTCARRLSRCSLAFTCIKQKYMHIFFYNTKIDIQKNLHLIQICVYVKVWLSVSNDMHMYVWVLISAPRFHRFLPLRLLYSYYCDYFCCHFHFHYLVHAIFVAFYIIYIHMYINIYTYTSFYFTCIALYVFSSITNLLLHKYASLHVTINLST